MDFQIIITNKLNSIFTESVPISGVPVAPGTPKPTVVAGTGSSNPITATNAGVPKKGMSGAKAVRNVAIGGSILTPLATASSSMAPTVKPSISAPTAPISSDVVTGTSPSPLKFKINQSSNSTPLAAPSDPAPAAPVTPTAAPATPAAPSDPAPAAPATPTAAPATPAPATPTAAPATPAPAPSLSGADFGDKAQKASDALHTSANDLVQAGKGIAGHGLDAISAHAPVALGMGAAGVAAWLARRRALKTSAKGF